MLCLVCYLFVINTSVIDCLGRFIPEMTYYVLGGMLNLIKLKLKLAYAVKPHIQGRRTYCAMRLPPVHFPAFAGKFHLHVEDATLSCLVVFYKKLRYREKHSASIVLSWCTL